MGDLDLPGRRWNLMHWPTGRIRSGSCPVPLCMMQQRIWFALTGIVAWIGLYHNPRWGIYPLVSALCALVGGGFAIRQLWLQSLPSDQVPSCGPDLSSHDRCLSAGRPVSRYDIRHRGLCCGSRRDPADEHCGLGLDRL